MLADPDPKSRRQIRKFLVASWALPVLALLYVGWVLLSRWQENREIEQRAAEQKRAQDQRAVEALGGNQFDVLAFYASPGFIRRGETARLCYSVSNAKSVHIEPPVGSVWPSYSRCLTISPQKSTSYTLTAEDSAGHTKTSTLVVQVR